MEHFSVEKLERMEPSSLEKNLEQKVLLVLHSLKDWKEQMVEDWKAQMEEDWKAQMAEDWKKL